ncbi:MAG: S41 family peptidase [Muribaculaceae bacterium]|nr:S41 family peptidase [Muribaculaceae bacterium]
MKPNITKIAVTCVIALLCVPATLFSLRADNNADIARNLDIFNSLYKELNAFYVDSINANESIENAINYMLNDIDPYTEYIPAKNHEDFLVVATGEYGGIGSYIMERPEGGVYISEPYENSPAAKAGLRAGDQILMIDNDSTTSWHTSAVSEHLKGQANTSLRLLIKRPYDPDSIKTVNIIREKIKLNPVPYYGLTRKSLGYINLSTFNEHSASQVKNALLDLKKNPAVNAIVLDLRGNGGGLVESAVQIVGMFVPKGTQVLQTKGRTEQQVKTYKTTEEPIDTKIPLFVLIDGGSASAAEITAGALQDLDRAVIMGDRSYGKGLVQTTRPLPFDAMLKVTIAKYYIPSGRLIQEFDYSHRNADGTAQRVPDSLANVFHTVNGREVRDGGGITPDVKINYPELNRLVYNIVRDNWAFDFATKFAAQHPIIPAVEDFAITDTIFNDFKRFINPDKFKYDRVCEQGLDNLRKIAKSEGYLNDSTKLAFDHLATLLKHDLQSDLTKNRKEISKLLASEIVKRYYYERGEIIQQIKDDETLDRAYIISVQPREYERILGITEKKK